MKIFYYTWYENSEQDMMDALCRMGHSVIKCHIPFSDYEEDPSFTEALERLFNTYECDIFLSFDFFPLIAKSADRLKKKYISWVYDMPHLTLFSPAAKSPYTYLFVFDQEQYTQLSSLKKEHLYHMPLAVNTVRLNEHLGNFLSETTYIHDVSFVGSLYEKNIYRQFPELPDYLRGYLNGIIQVQQKIYGYNLIGELLSDTFLDELQHYAPLSLGANYPISRRCLYTDVINTEVTCQERISLFSAIAAKNKFTLYTGSDATLVPNAIAGGTISYNKEMPEVFRHSKINLNVTFRPIVSGIPLRALDIMGAGGFLLSNYQRELAEYFVDGEELVLFESSDDMLAKIDYYLCHNEERQAIARRGWEKIQKCFSYEIQLHKILEHLVH